MRRVFRLFALALALGSLFGASGARADSPLTLTLTGPATYLPGQPPAPFDGTLTLGSVGVPATSVDVLVDGVVKATATTDTTGAYVVQLPVFESDVNHTVQTRAFGGLPIETVSPVLVVKPLFAVTVTRTGAGAGVVMSVTPSGIDCGATCSMYVPNETEVTLSADPDDVSTFNGWSGACAGNGDCVIVVTSDTSVTATFQPLPPAQLAINPTGHSFGSVVLGGVSAPMTFTVTNVGGLPSGSVAPSLVGPDAPHFQIVSSSCAAPLAAGGSCAVTARFAPGSGGPKNATLTVVASPGGVASASLQGFGLTPAQLVIAPPSYNYGSVSVFSPGATANFTVFNAGQATSGPIGLSMSGANAPEFQIISSSCGAPLPGGGSCYVVVRFDPSGFGTKTAALAAFAAPGGSAYSYLNGTGTF